MATVESNATANNPSGEAPNSRADWEPEEAELRDGEPSDEFSHADAIVDEQYELAREEGDLPDGFDERGSVRSARLLAIAFAAVLLLAGLLVVTGGGL